MVLSSPASLNNKVIVEIYEKTGLKSTVQNGFALVSQKVEVKGLKVLVDARITSGNSSYVIPKGSTAYVREELLHTQVWATKALESDAIESKFLILDLAYIEFVVPPKESGL